MSRSGSIVDDGMSVVMSVLRGVVRHQDYHRVPYGPMTHMVQ